MPHILILLLALLAAIPATAQTDVSSRYSASGPLSPGKDRFAVIECATDCTLTLPPGPGRPADVSYNSVGAGTVTITGQIGGGANSVTLAPAAGGSGTVLSWSQTDRSWYVKSSGGSIGTVAAAGLTPRTCYTGEKGIGLALDNSFFVYTLSGCVAPRSITITTPSGTLYAGASYAANGGTGGTAPSNVDMKIDAGAFTVCATPTIGSNLWSCPITLPAAGSHTITVRETDSTGVTAVSGAFTTTTAPTYEGAKDTVPTAILALYGGRGADAATAASLPALQLCQRASQATCADVTPAANGYTALPTNLAGVDCTGGGATPNCVVKTAYDMSGNARHIVFGGTLPDAVTVGPQSAVCIKGNAATTSVSAAGAAAGGALSWTWVALYTNAGGVDTVIAIGSNRTNFQFDSIHQAGSGDMSAVASSVSTLYSMFGVMNGASPATFASVNGGASVLGTVSAFTDSGIFLLSADGTTQPLIGTFCEGVIWNAVLTAGNGTTLHTQQATAWGVP